jgi:NOL1/NOP2/fmu family ribosome biogenesis protein
VPQRTSVLAENMSKWGDPDCIVTRSMPKDFGKLGGVFDVILTDVPCSGEGMFRKDAQAIEEWSQENVRMCRDRQREIVSAVWPALKPGGILIYSTCTFNQYEDEEQVDWIAETLHAEVLPVSTEESWKVTGNRLKDEAKRHLPVYHFLPGQSRGEGFFLAVLRKKEAETDGAESCGASQRAKKKMKKNGNTSNQSVAGAPLRTLKSWLKEPDKYIFDRREERYFAIDRGFFDLYKQMDGAIHIVQAGIPMARIKGKDLIPETTLALSTQLCTETFPQVTLKYADAIAYLRHESLTLDESVENGFVLMCYDGLPLGFVKNVGKHANNLYPAEWRIRSAMR